MGVQLRPREPVPQGIRRILVSQMDEAMRLLANPREKEAIHDARVCCKRIRSVLRLIREGLGDERYHEENACFRDAKAPLAPIRDAEVLAHTVHTLKQYATGRPDLGQLDAMAHLFEREYQAVCDQVLGDGQVTGKIIHHIGNAVERMEQYLNDAEVRDGRHRIGKPMLYQGIRKLYRRGWKAGMAACGTPTAERLHEWRKQAKYLRYQLEVIERKGPKRIRKLRERLTILTDQLGYDHDLAMLAHRLAGNAAQFGGEQAIAPWLGIIADRRQALQKEAIRLGKKLYADKPGRFIRQLQ